MLAVVRQITSSHAELLGKMSSANAGRIVHGQLSNARFSLSPIIVITGMLQA